MPFLGVCYVKDRQKGRTQVNKALHTCTSWYAYAAMFGSSTGFTPKGGGYMAPALALELTTLFRVI